MEAEGLLPDECVHLPYDEGPPQPSAHPYRRGESVRCEVRESQRIPGRARIRLPRRFSGVVTGRDRLRVVARGGRVVEAVVYALVDEPVVTSAGLICEVTDVGRREAIPDLLR